MNRRICRQAWTCRRNRKLVNEWSSWGKPREPCSSLGERPNRRARGTSRRATFVGGHCRGEEGVQRAEVELNSELNSVMVELWSLQWTVGWYTVDVSSCIGQRSKD